MPIKILIPLVALLFIGILIDLVRKRRLLETHALLWLLTFAVVAVSPLLIPVLDRLAHLVGIYYPPTLYLLVAIFFLMANGLRNTTVISRLTEQNRRLTQEMAILRHQIETGERPPEPAASATPPRPATGASPQ